MATANSGVPKGQVVTGARGYLTANGKIIGYVSGVDMQQTINEMPIEVIGDLLTSEHVTGGITYSGNMARVEVLGSTLVEAGISVPLDQVFTRAALGFALIDEVSGTVYRTMERVKLTGKSFSYAKNAVTMMNCPFVCIQSRDANGVLDV